MDGNRRWASKLGLNGVSGHSKGAKVLKRVVDYCGKVGVKELTVFAFSTENWKRPKSEVDKLINLFEIYIKSEIAEINSNNVIFRAVGKTKSFSKSFYDLLQHAQDITKNNSGLSLNIALNYGGKADLVYAAKEVAKEVKNNKLMISEINEELFKSHLYSNEINDFDLLIRTSGEQRLSNFMLWQSSYSEVFFTDTLWPDLTLDEFKNILKSFHTRERRYGSSVYTKDANTRAK